MQMSKIIKIKYTKTIFLCFIKKVSFLPKFKSCSIKPLLFKPIFLRIFPFSSVTTEIPELAERISGIPFSTDRKIDAVKCCLGPIKFPNQASFVMFIKSSIFLLLNVWNIAS